MFGICFVVFKGNADIYFIYSNNFLLNRNVFEFIMKLNDSCEFSTYSRSTKQTRKPATNHVFEMKSSHQLCQSHKIIFLLLHKRSWPETKCSHVHWQFFLQFNFSIKVFYALKCFIVLRQHGIYYSCCHQS